MKECRVLQPAPQQIARQPDRQHRGQPAPATHQRLLVGWPGEYKNLRVLIDRGFPVVTPVNQPAHPPLADPSPELQSVLCQSYGGSDRRDCTGLREVVPLAHEMVVNRVAEGAREQEHIGRHFSQLPPARRRGHRSTRRGLRRRRGWAARG